MTFTLNGIATETGLDRRTVARILATAGVQPVADGKNVRYRMRDFLRAWRAEIERELRPPNVEILEDGLREAFRCLADVTGEPARNRSRDL